jgi:hypothetical protein
MADEQPLLVWTDTDATADGRFSIQTERIRGEGTWYNLLVSQSDRLIAHKLGLDLGKGDKRAMKRMAQRIVDHSRERGLGEGSRFD